MAMWWQNNNLSLNITKTKEMIVGYRKRRTEHTPPFPVVHNHLLSLSYIEG